MAEEVSSAHLGTDVTVTVEWTDTVTYRRTFGLATLAQRLDEFGAARENWLGEDVDIDTNALADLSALDDVLGANDSHGLLRGRRIEEITVRGLPKQT